MTDCPVCCRDDNESRQEAWRRAELRAIRKPTADNKRAARMARACLEPLSVRLSRIWFRSQALESRPWENMDISLTVNEQAWGENWLSPKQLALKHARDGVRLDGINRAWWARWD